MLAERAVCPPPSQSGQRASFFRQSGWLMIANITGGILMYAVHPLARSTGPEEYGIFLALLGFAMCIPTIPLQMVLAQQTAKALATNRERELSGIIRWLWLGTFGLWALGSFLALLFQKRILLNLHLSNPVGLWVTLPALLFALWMPLFQGALQGRQNFLWLGWSMMSNAGGRLAIAAVAVLALRWGATGMMAGVLLGMAVAAGLAIWQSRSLWRVPAQSFDWRSLLGQVIPLMLGCGAVQFLFTADTIFVKSYFPNQAGFYGSAGTLSRALMWLVGPLVAVMFPRVVHSAAKAEKTNLVGPALIGTAILAVGGAVGLSVLGPWVVRFIYGSDPNYARVAASVFPWYAGAMVPLALANVLLNVLLAKSLFKVVPYLCLLAIGYAFALTRFHGSLIAVLQTLGVCSFLLLAVCAWFTWAVREPRPLPSRD